MPGKGEAMRRALVPLAIALVAGMAAAKLPPPDDAAKAKTAEAAAKAAWQGKVDAYQLCKAQDRVAALYRKTSGKAAAPPAGGASAKAAQPMAAAASAPASASSGTPVSATPPPPCAEPGPFAYNPPEQKPLETSEAHSPSGTAASPPSVKEHSGIVQAPKKP
jgi:hypothetical protein